MSPLTALADEVGSGGQVRHALTAPRGLSRRLR
jgi:hypothetical protein